MNKKKLVFYVGGYGAMLALLVYAIQSGTIGIFIKNFTGFLTGNRNIEATDHAISVWMAIILLSAIMTEVCRALTMFFGKVHQIGSTNTLQDVLYGLLPSALAEEFIFRWLPLVLLVKISFLSSDAAFYTLLFLSNTVWTLLHIQNYQGVGKPMLFSLTSTFIAGLFFSFVLLKFGFWAAGFAHFAINLQIAGLFKFRQWARIIRPL